MTFGNRDRAVECVLPQYSSLGSAQPLPSVAHVSTFWKKQYSSLFVTKNSKNLNPHSCFNRPSCNPAIFMGTYQQSYLLSATVC